METPAIVTRQKRKRVHSTKCPCCSHEQGKPELQARPSRKRKVDEVKREETPLLKTKRPAKSAKSKKKAEQEVFSSGFKDTNESNKGRILRSGRSTPVCVETNTAKEKLVSQKASAPEKKTKKIIKQSLVDKELIKQEDATENKEVSDIESDIELATLFGITPTNTDKINTKTKKQPSKIRNKKSQPSRKNVQKNGKASKAKIVSKSNKQKGVMNIPKITKPKNAKISKTRRFNRTTEAERPKKTSAIEKLKLRAFDDLKEKLEIAFDRSSISVPECAKLLQKITSPNLSEIFYSQPASVDVGSSELPGKNVPERMIEGMDETENTISNKETTEEKAKMKENVVPENKAAQALVSFKTQTASSNSRNNLVQSSNVLSDSSTQLMQAVVNNDHVIQNENNLARLPGQWLEKPNISNPVIATTPTLKQTSTQARFEETLNIPTAHSVVGIPSISQQKSQTVNNQVDSHDLGNDSLVTSNSLTSVTKQLLQTANPVLQTTNQIVHTTIPLLPTSQVHLTMNSQPPKASQAPALTNPLIPTSNQLLQTNSLLQRTSQFLSTLSNSSATSKSDTAVVPISPVLPVIQTQSIFMNQPQVTALQLVQTQGTNSTLPTITQTNPQFMCPSLPKITTPNQQPTILTAPHNQPLVLPKISSHIEQNTLGSTLPTILPDVKQAYDGFLPQTVSTAAQPRMGTLPTTSMNELPNSCKLRPILPRQPLVSPTLTLLPNVQNIGNSADISNNVKQAVKRLVNGRTKITDNNSTKQTTTLPDIASTFTNNSHTKAGAMIVAQNNTEMASKEQAIKALLSIGSEQQITRQGLEGTINVTGNNSTEHQKQDDSLVVFDTNKAIFKVDDVIIDPQVNTIGKESYTCGKCGKIFTSLSYLARHIKRVCPDMTHRKWKCNHCDKAFRHPFGLQQHIFTHTGERPHKCTQCPKAFYSSNDLRRHSRIHSGERPYNCKHCGKTFATTISLKTHTFIHTGEKPHRCPHCPKTFATSSKLGRHIVTHSEQRPFACTQCPKTFNRSGDLRRHNLNLHEGKCSVGEIEEKHDSNENTNLSEKLITNIDGQIPE